MSKETNSGNDTQISCKAVRSSRNSGEVLKRGKRQEAGQTVWEAGSHEDSQQQERQVRVLLEGSSQHFFRLLTKGQRAKGCQSVPA